MTVSRTPPRSPSWTRSGGAGGADGDVDVDVDESHCPLIIAHRGASAIEPENSLQAFRRAGQDGADGVELDVLQCGSGDVVVFHDDDLARLADRPDRIAALPLSAVRNVRLKSGASIPTLAEALEACGGSLLVNVELKAAGVTPSQVAALVDAVATTLDRAGEVVSARVLVSSFSPRAVARWLRRSPRVRAGLLFEREAPLPLRRAWALPWLRPFSVHPESVLCTTAAVRRWHRRGYRVSVWTVDGAAALRQFADMGVDGIITNDPARARAALRDRAGTGSVNS
ncbi:MAG: glycerophosphodiester phosphodiesterase [Verrucomicrobiota bacterium]